MLWKVVLKADVDKEILILEEQGIINRIYTIKDGSERLRAVHIAAHKEDITEVIDRSDRLDGIIVEKLTLKEAVLFAFKIRRESLLGPMMKELRQYGKST